MESFFTQMMLGLRLACVLVPKLHNKSSASDSLQNCVEFGACSHPPTDPSCAMLLPVISLQVWAQGLPPKLHNRVSASENTLQNGVELGACLFVCFHPSCKKIKRFSVSRSFTKWYRVWGMLVCLLASMQAAKKKREREKPQKFFCKWFTKWCELGWSLLTYMQATQI